MAKPALLAKLTAKEGQRDDLLAVIADLGMKNVSGEPGTEIYAAHKDAELTFSDAPVLLRKRLRPGNV